MNLNSQYFKLYSGCKIIEGATRALLCDLDRRKMKLLPLSLVTFTKSLSEGESVGEVLNKYEREEKEILQQYLEYLTDNEYGFFCDKKEFKAFIDVNEDFEIPKMISNAIVELENFDKEYITCVFEELDKVGCEAVQIACYFSLTKNEVDNLFTISNNSNVENIEIITSYNQSYATKFFIDLNGVKNKLTYLQIYNYPFDSLPELENILFKIDITKDNISSFTNCGVISVNHFNVHRYSFLESKNYNSCLYKKISIDPKGNIKNCPAFAKGFGNINSKKLKDIISTQAFTSLWKINKDKIEGCKICEFRHVCTDCRAFLENPKNVFSKPLKCGYDPLKGEWYEWSENPLKKEAIAHYDL